MYTEYLWIVILGGFIAVLTAYGIGANEVANCFGTSVGTRALTLRQAIVVATFCELAGALLLGSGVTKTIEAGIADTEDFANAPALLMYCMLTVLFATAFWMLLATYLELPVSATHATVGGVIGSVMVARGPAAVDWASTSSDFPFLGGVAKIVAFWVIAPILTGLLAMALFLTLRTCVLRRKRSEMLALLVTPILFGISSFIVISFIIKQTGSGYGWNDTTWGNAYIIAGATAVGMSILGLVVINPLIMRRIRLYKEKQRRKAALSQHGTWQPPEYDEGVPTQAEDLAASGQLATTSMHQLRQYMEDHHSSASQHSEAVPPSAIEAAAKEAQARLAQRARLDTAYEPPVSDESNEVGKGELHPTESLTVRNGVGPQAGQHHLMHQASMMSERNSSQAGGGYPPSPPSSSWVGQTPHASMQNGHINFTEAEEDGDYISDGVEDEAPAGVVVVSGHGDVQQGKVVSEQRSIGPHPSTRMREFKRVFSRNKSQKNTDDWARTTEEHWGAYLDRSLHGSDAMQSIRSSHDNEARGPSARNSMHDNAPVDDTPVQSGPFAVFNRKHRKQQRNKKLRARSNSMKATENGAARQFSVTSQLHRLSMEGTKEVPRHRTGGGWGKRAITTFRQSDTWKALTYGTSVNIHQMDEEYAALEKFHGAIEQFDPATEQTFSYLQIFSAMANSFAHGSNDVANAVGPFAAIYHIYSTMQVSTFSSNVPVWVLAMGGGGVVVGLATYGYKVIRAIGIKLTKLTNSRGFVCEFASAAVIIVGSRYSLPLSTTHCMVAAITTLGLLEGRKALNWTLALKFVIGWLATVLVAGLLAALLTAQGIYAPSKNCVDQLYAFSTATRSASEAALADATAINNAWSQYGLYNETLQQSISTLEAGWNSTVTDQVVNVPLDLSLSNQTRELMGQTLFTNGIYLSGWNLTSGSANFSALLQWGTEQLQQQIGN